MFQRADMGNGNHKIVPVHDKGNDACSVDYLPSSNSYQVALLDYSNDIMLLDI